MNRPHGSVYAEKGWVMAASPHRGAPLKERLLGSGGRLFNVDGYHGTAVDALLSDSGVQKGSFYHHFGSKLAFGLAVVDRYYAYQAGVLASWAEREDLAVPERLAGYHREFAGRVVSSGWQRSCLIGKLSNELGATSEPFRERFADYLTQWKRDIVGLLLTGQERGEVRDDMSADRLADAVLAMIQGAFASALVLRESEYLEAVTRGLLDLLRGNPEARTALGHAPEPQAAAPASSVNQDMASPVPHREKLLREGLNQLLEHGYHATTIDRLLAVSGVPKGSFYHHFGSKEDFVVEVLRSYGGFHQRRLAAWAEIDHLSTADLLGGYFDELSGTFIRSGYCSSDLVAKLATEVAGTSARLRAQMDHFIDAWRSQVEGILVEGQERGDVRPDRPVGDLSAAVSALVHGSFVVGTSTRSQQSLVAVRSAIADLVANPRPALAQH
jgi:TetR/AcrR family transcriptional repressor of nem operon